MENFQKIEKIGIGAYGVVYKCRNIYTGQIVAIKNIRLENNNEGIPSTAIREISLLKELKHPNIVTLEDVSMDDNRLYLVFEYLSMDLKKYMDTLPRNELMEPELVRSYLHQITFAISFCHRRRVLHRDLKPPNLLINKDGVIKVADFGLGRSFSVSSNRIFTHEIVTLWYRAPEVLLGATRYLCPVDIWSIGCIFAEMVTRKPLFKGDSEIHQLFCIFNILKTPNEDIWPNVSSLADYKTQFPRWNQNLLPDKLQSLNSMGIDLIQKMLTYNPDDRISAKEILNHTYFDGFNKALIPIK